MDNLQTEVLHMEFHEFAKGTFNITELDFARQVPKGRDAKVDEISCPSSLSHQLKLIDKPKHYRPTVYG